MSNVIDMKEWGKERRRLLMGDKADNIPLSGRTKEHAMKAGVPINDIPKNNS